jgi:hypothetical protein
MSPLPEVIDAAAVRGTRIEPAFCSHEAAVLLLSGCASETTPEGLTCIEPPTTEVRADSDLVLTVEPNPVETGGEATLTLERGGLSFHTVAGAGVHWQCSTEESG